MTAEKARRYAVAMFLIVSLFFFWGMANNLNDILIKQFKKAFTLTDLQSGLVQSAFYLGYFLFAIPAAMVMRRLGYKKAVVIGLLLYGAGALLFWPAAQAASYGFFLFALFVIASGLAFLETCANPLMIALGSPDGAARRLNLAQAFNPVGNIVGVLIGGHFILTGYEPSAVTLAAMPVAERTAFYAREAHQVQFPYLVLGLVVLAWAAVVAWVRFPAIAETPEPQGERVSGAFGKLLRQQHYMFGVIAQFFYVGAQVGLWSFVIRYAEAETGVGEKTGADLLTVSLGLFLLGRFVGTLMIDRIGAARQIAIYAAANILLTIIAALAGGTTGLVALLASSFFMSVMFPSIFALSLEGMGALTKPGASFLVMAIAGGAVLPALMGRVSDMSAIRFAMLVPAVCFAIVLGFAMSRRQRPLQGQP